MFRFSLQNVLEVRERFEKIKYKEYSAELLVQQNLRQQTDSRREALRSSGQHLEQVKQVSPSALPMQWHNQFRQRLEEEMEVLAAQLRDQNEAVEEKRKELVEARRSHRALEILRDKEYKRYRDTERRLERAVMDEIASIYHHYQQ